MTIIHVNPATTEAATILPLYLVDAIGGGGLGAGGARPTAWTQSGLKTRPISAQLNSVNTANVSFIFRGFGVTESKELEPMHYIHMNNG